MESAEQNFSIDHFEEKFETFIPVLKRANQQEASGCETDKHEQREGMSQRITEEIKDNVSKPDEVLPQEKSEGITLPNKMVVSEAASKEKLEITMGVKRDIEVEIMKAKETDQEMNVQDINPEAPQKSELNPFIGSKDTGADQAFNVNLKGNTVTSRVENEMITKEVGQLADKQQALNVIREPNDAKSGVLTNEKGHMTSQLKTSIDSLERDVLPNITVEMVTKESSLKSSPGNIADVGIEQKEVQIENPNTIFKSEIERPSNLSDIEAQQASQLGNKYQASTSIFVKNSDNAQSIQKVEKADNGSVVSKSQPIEVERKFQVTDFDENKLFQANGKLISEISFEDVYYDNNSYGLILNDCWLRKRNHKWEFKIPVNRDPNMLYMSTQFRELEDEKDIRLALHEIIKPETKFCDDQEIIEEFKLQPFATFTTTRKSYKIPFNCTVVIDFTSFGYSVGEIETMIEDNSEIEDAIERINVIAAQLGFQMLSIMELAKC